MKKIVILALGLLGLNTAANAQATASATATAVIITPITITKTVDMHFGNVAVGATGGTVVLTPAGTRTPNGGVTLPATVGTPAAASFNVTGQASYTYAISLPSTATTISSGANNMTVDTWVSNPSGTGTLAVGTPGTQTVTVGATLTVGAAQAAGTYVSATPFDVTVNYN